MIETSNWEMLGMAHALQELGDSIEAELPAEDLDDGNSQEVSAAREN